MTPPEPNPIAPNIPTVTAGKTAAEPTPIRVTANAAAAYGC